MIGTIVICVFSQYKIQNWCTQKKIHLFNVKNKDVFRINFENRAKSFIIVGIYFIGFIIKQTMVREWFL